MKTHEDDWIRKPFRYLHETNQASDLFNDKPLSPLKCTSTNHEVGSSNLSKRTTSLGFRVSGLQVSLPFNQKVTKAGNENMLTTDQVAALEGVARKTVVKWCESGEIPAHRVLKGSRQTWRIPTNYKNRKVARDWDTFKKAWLGTLSSGWLNGKPVGKHGIYTYEYGIAKFFEMLKVQPSLDYVTLENLRLALSSFEIDYENRICHYSQRNHVYTAFNSVRKYLVETEQAQPFEAHRLRKLKPKRIFPPIKNVVRENDFLTLIQFNETYIQGKRKFDIALSRTMIGLMGLGGLRREEIINLRLEDVDLTNCVIHVIDGKGHKNRDIGILPFLADILHIWLERVRLPANVATGKFLITNTGREITSSTVNKKIKRLSDASGIPVTPHGLRRSCATLLENKGMPLSMVQMLLGHADLKTTQGYIMSDKQKMLEWMRG